MSITQEPRTKQAVFIISRTIIKLLISVAIATLVAACNTAGTPQAPSTAQPTLDPRFTIDALEWHSGHAENLPATWEGEIEIGGKITVNNDQMEIDVPAGATLWFKPLLTGPVLIQYRATVISNRGPNDRVSDLNCFWMARDSRDPDDLFAIHRNGSFADYNPLLCYYVGMGGNGNTTTRFRRYIGSPTTRPLLPQHDLRDRADLLTPNVEQLIQLVAYGSLIQFYRDGHRIFEFNDPHPYTSGWFGFRTTQSHLRIRSFAVYHLSPTLTR